MPAIARIPAIADVLGEVPIFAALTGEEREELASHMRVRHFARDEVIFHRDDPSGHFFAIVAGTVKLTAHDDAGRELAIAILRGGDLFGELEQQGIVAIGRRHIEVKDLARLQRQIRY